MGFSILISAEVFEHEPKVWYLDGTIGVLIGLIILAYGVKYVIFTFRFESMHVNGFCLTCAVSQISYLFSLIWYFEYIYSH